jgi:hypothetical protein
MIVNKLSNSKLPCALLKQLSKCRFCGLALWLVHHSDLGANGVEWFCATKELVRWYLNNSSRNNNIINKIIRNPISAPLTVLTVVTLKIITTSTIHVTFRIQEVVVQLETERAARLT